MQDEPTGNTTAAKHLRWIELLARLEPLPDEDTLREIDDPPPEPVTCFDDEE